MPVVDEVWEWDQVTITNTKTILTDRASAGACECPKVTVGLMVLGAEIKLLGQVSSAGLKQPEDPRSVLRHSAE